MLRKEDFIVIKALKERGVYIKDIAEDLGVHPRTVSRALRRDGAPSGKRKRRGSKLDPYKARVDEMLADNIWNAMVILRELQEAGYDGGITILRNYIRPKRALRSGRATVRFETEPGQQLQSDWGELWTQIAGKKTKVFFIVNTLSYSRRFHFWATDSLDAEHTYEGLIRSMEYFGGVPAEVLVDNQKATVLTHRVGQKPQFNERFVDLAGQYGFTPRACRPRRARTKGKTERMVGYIKQNFFVRYQRFESWAHLNQLAAKWLAEEADQRVHGTVQEVVATRFQREQPTLQPLPTQRFDTSYRQQRHVSWDAYVEVNGNRYSVPGELSGTRVSVHIGLDGLLRVFQADVLVARHRLRDRQEGWVTVPEHHRLLWQDALQVQQRSLQVYDEVTSWSS